MSDLKTPDLLYSPEICRHAGRPFLPEFDHSETEPELATESDESLALGSLNLIFYPRRVLTYTTNNRKMYQQNPCVSNHAVLDSLGGDLAIKCLVKDPANGETYQIDISINDQNRPLPEAVIKAVGFQALTQPVEELHLMGEQYWG